jgi:uncharacterized protein
MYFREASLLNCGIAGKSNSALLLRFSNMKWTFIILCLLSASFAIAQPGLQWPAGEAGKDYNVVDAQGKRQGPWIRVYQTNPKVLYYRGQFKDGVPVGEWEWYYDSGELMKKMINGKTKRCREGDWKLYTELGVLRAEEHYADSLLEGVCKYYFDNGQLCALIQYKQGVKDGPFTEYYDNGKKHREGTYLRDDFEGPMVLYHENGTKQAEGKYVKGLQDGVWTHYKTNGSIEMSVLYKMGKEVKRQYIEGTYTEYYDSGLPKAEYTWESGRKNGPFKEWYDKGHYEQVPVSSDDAKLGITYREKLTGQVLKREGDFLNDQLEGEITTYDEEGKEVLVEQYVGGKLTSSRKP